MRRGDAARLGQLKVSRLRASALAQGRRARRDAPSPRETHLSRLSSAGTCCRPATPLRLLKAAHHHCHSFSRALPVSARSRAARAVAAEGVAAIDVCVHTARHARLAQSRFTGSYGSRAARACHPASPRTRRS